MNASAEDRLPDSELLAQMRWACLHLHSYLSNITSVHLFSPRRTRLRVHYLASFSRLLTTKMHKTDYARNFRRKWVKRASLTTKPWPILITSMQYVKRHCACKNSLPQFLVSTHNGAGIPQSLASHARMSTLGFNQKCLTISLQDTRRYNSPFLPSHQRKQWKRHTRGPRAEKHGSCCINFGLKPQSRNMGKGRPGVESAKMAFFTPTKCYEFPNSGCLLPPVSINPELFFTELILLQNDIHWRWKIVHVRFILCNIYCFTDHYMYSGFKFSELEMSAYTYLPTGPWLITSSEVILSILIPTFKFTPAQEIEWTMLVSSPKVKGSEDVKWQLPLRVEMVSASR